MGESVAQLFEAFWTSKSFRFVTLASFLFLEISFGEQGLFSGFFLHFFFMLSIDVLLLIAQGCLAWLTAPNEQMETLKCGDSISGNV